MPRVRWEASRRVAHLIREGQADAAQELLAWMSGRELESEVLAALGVLHGFGLAPHFAYEEVREAVRKPSLLSDRMLWTNFRQRSRDHVFRYAISPSRPASLAEEYEGEFERWRDGAVPPVFLGKLEDLERDVDFAFVERWQHDWRWVRRTVGWEVPEPDFFTGSDRSHGAYLHLRASEILVSAYLRTLAYAMHIGKLGMRRAEACSMLALPLNQGLADLEPVARPSWSRELLPRWRKVGREIARQLWNDAALSCGPGDTPAALTVVEVDNKDFVEVEIDAVAGRGDAALLEPSVRGSSPLQPYGEAGTMAGNISHDAQGAWHKPTRLCSPVFPQVFGRLDTEVALHVKLACLPLGFLRGRVGCKDNSVELALGGETVSRWIHWYADWQPAKPRACESTVCGMTTVARKWLQSVEGLGSSIMPLVRVRVGTREHEYTDHDVRVEEFWIEPEP